MAKPNPLAQGLEKQQTPARAVRPARTAAPPEHVPKASAPSRFGRVLIGGHFAPEVQTALKIIAAEERTTVQALLEEGINTVFAKRHKPEIADIPVN